MNSVSGVGSRITSRVAVGIARRDTGIDNRTMSNQSVSNRTVSNRAMAPNEWERRIARAEELGAQYGFAAEILRLYVSIARFQEDFYRDFGSLHGSSLEHMSAGSGDAASDFGPFSRPFPAELTARFGTFLSMIEPSGPSPLREAARELRDGGQDSHFRLLTAFWNGSGTGVLPPGPTDFFARAFLQPYAAWIRTRSNMSWSGPTPYLCPFCKRKPVVGILRPLGDGGQRSLVCSFCLAEWEFRRIVCPGCGEENHAKLPVYTAEELKHVRVEACDSCRSYIKTVDLTKSGLAEPIVDEMASIPLDLWAEQQGYSKLQPNLMQL